MGERGREGGGSEVSVACGAALLFDHPGVHLSEVMDVPCTLLNVHGLPKLVYPLHKLLFGVWLYFSSEMFFHFVPQVLYGVHVWALRRGSPPIDPFLVEELNCSPGCMLGIIILHQSVSCRIDLTKEWQERVLVVYSSASMIPSKMHTAVLPLRLIPAQTCTFTGCFGLRVSII